MNGLIEGWVDGWIKGGEWMAGGVDERMVRQIGGWVDGRMDEW